jgi:hypothetical protein
LQNRTKSFDASIPRAVAGKARVHFRIGSANIALSDLDLQALRVVLVHTTGIQPAAVIFEQTGQVTHKTDVKIYVDSEREGAEVCTNLNPESIFADLLQQGVQQSLITLQQPFLDRSLEMGHYSNEDFDTVNLTRLNRGHSAIDFEEARQNGVSFWKDGRGTRRDDSQTPHARLEDSAERARWWPNVPGRSMLSSPQRHTTR